MSAQSQSSLPCCCSPPASSSPWCSAHCRCWPCPSDMSSQCSPTVGWFYQRTPPVETSLPPARRLLLYKYWIVRLANIKPLTISQYSSPTIISNILTEPRGREKIKYNFQPEIGLNLKLTVTNSDLIAFSPQTPSLKLLDLKIIFNQKGTTQYLNRD